MLGMCKVFFPEASTLTTRSTSISDPRAEPTADIGTDGDEGSSSTPSTSPPPPPPLPLQKCDSMVDLIFINDQSGSTCGDDQLPNAYFSAAYSFSLIETCTELKQGCNLGRGCETGDNRVQYKNNRVHKYEAQRRFIMDVTDTFMLNAQKHTRIGMV